MIPNPKVGDPIFRNISWPVTDTDPDVELITALMSVLDWHKLAGGTKTGGINALIWALEHSPKHYQPTTTEGKENNASTSKA